MSIIAKAVLTRTKLSLGLIKKPVPARRGVVSRCSEKSLSRLAAYCDETDVSYKYMGTLTVGSKYSENPDDFRRGVAQFLQYFLAAQKKHSECNGQDSVCWFIEFQRRGAPHLHFFYTSRVPWALAAIKWANICHENGLCAESDEMERTGTRFERLRGGQTGMTRYARKYAAKRDQKIAPSWWQGRFWGVRGAKTRGCRHEASAELGSSQAVGLSGLGERMSRLELAVMRIPGVRRVAWKYGSGAVYWAPDTWPDEIVREFGVLAVRLAILASPYGAGD